MKKVYLDNAATTKIDPEVLEVMLPFFREKFGNPSSLHSWGREAREAIEKSRGEIAALLNCQPKEIIFSGTTTEADNLAIVGAAKASFTKGSHLITSPIEHHGALDAFKALGGNGFDVSYLSVDKYGLVNLSELERSIKASTILVNVMYANNEVGTIEPISELSKRLKKINKEHVMNSKAPIFFHTDAASAKYLELDVQKLGVDLMTLGPHKFYGPKGVGILYVKRGTRIQSIIKGGMHEHGLRPGTENVPAIIGAAKALEILERDKKVQAEKITKLRDKLIDGVLEKIPDSQLTGHFQQRVPDIVSFTFAGAEGESILLLLDQEGIAASSGSACTSGILEPSHVLTAMGIPAELAHGSVRFSLGRHTTDEDIDYVLEKLPPIIEKLRRMAPK